MTAIEPNFALPAEAVDFAQAQGKSAALDLLAQQFEHAYGYDRIAVLEALELREKLGSTGFGDGAAIPHARLKDIDRPAAVVIKLASPIPFDSADDLPVDLMIGLLSPYDGGAAHLQALAEISRILRDSGSLASLQNAQSRDALLAAVEDLREQDAG